MTCPVASHQTINSTSTTGNLAIGGNLATNGNLTLGSSAGIITINNALTPIYTYPIPNNTQIGWIVKPTLTWNQSGDGVLLTQTLPAGVYIFNISISVYGTPFGNFIYPVNSTNQGYNSPNALFFRVPFAYSGLGSGSGSINVATGTFAFTMAPVFPATTGTVKWYNCVSNNHTLDVYDTSCIRVA